MHPVHYHDRLAFSVGGPGIQLTCSDASLPVDSRNLVHRAAAAFLEAAGDRRRPHPSGKENPPGGGTRRWQRQRSHDPAGNERTFRQSAGTGRIPFACRRAWFRHPVFSANQTCAGHRSRRERRFPGTVPGVARKFFLLVHPGFGISTPWAYQNLARFPEALNGHAGRAQQLANLLQRPDCRRPLRNFTTRWKRPRLKNFRCSRCSRNSFIPTARWWR